MITHTRPTVYFEQALEKFEMLIGMVHGGDAEAEDAKEGGGTRASPPIRTRVLEGLKGDQLSVYIDRVNMWGFENDEQLLAFLNACGRTQVCTDDDIHTRTHTHTHTHTRTHTHTQKIEKRNESTQVKLGAEKSAMMTQGTQPFFGAHYGPGRDDDDDRGRVILCSVHGCVVTIPFKYKRYIARVARKCGVNVQRNVEARSPFPVNGLAATCQAEQVVAMTTILRRDYGMSRFDVGFSAYGPWDKMRTKPNGTPGTVNDTLLGRYGLAWSPDGDEQPVLKAIYDAVSSPPSADGRSVIGSADFRFHVAFKGDEFAEDVVVYRCHGPHRNVVMSHHEIPQTLAAVCEHMHKGGEADDLPGVALKASMNAAGAVKMGLGKGFDSKRGDRLTSQMRTPSAIVQFTQVIVYAHDPKQSALSANGGAVNLSNPRIRPTATERQARCAVNGVWRMVESTEGSDEDEAVEDLGAPGSEDLELSGTFGGAATQAATFEEFVKTFLDKAEEICSNGSVRIAGVIPAKVWKRMLRGMCDHMCGGGGKPQYFRESSEALTEAGWHALTCVLSMAGFSFREMGYLRKAAMPVTCTAKSTEGEFRFMSEPPRRSSKFGRYRGVKLAHLFIESMVRIHDSTCKN